MLKKSTLLAFAGALTLGVAMFSAGSADARGFAGGGGYHGGGFKVGGGHASLIRHPGRPGIHIHPRWPRPHWHYGFRRHYWIAPVATYAVARPAVAAVPGPCTCLSKEYTPEGAVLFKDRCTNEMAMNPPVQAAPQQTSYQTAPVQPGQPQQAYVPTYPGPAAQTQPVAQ